MYLVSAGRNLARLQEEVRLVEFAQSTRVRYADMGVFSAVARNQWSPIQQQMHDQINRKKESYRLSSTCGAPRNHTNVPPVDAHVDDSYMYQLSLVVGHCNLVFDRYTPLEVDQIPNNSFFVLTEAYYVE